MAKVEVTLFAGSAASCSIDGGVEFNTDLYAYAMVARLAAASGVEESPVGFTSHVHSQGAVLGDPDTNAVGLPTRTWLANVGVAPSEVALGVAGYRWVYTPAFSRYSLTGG